MSKLDQKSACGWALAILFVLMLVANYWLHWHHGPRARVSIWLLTTVLSIGAVCIIGVAVSGRISGLFIDARNMMSLSKFQMVVWTLVVLPALITAAAANLALAGAGPDLMNALNIDIPTELLGALGLTGATMAASPIVLGTKAGAAPHPEELANTSRSLGLDSTQVKSVGKVFGKADPKLASWSDMFLGDEVGNADAPDLGKIQQFFITFLLAGIYLYALSSLFGGDAHIATLPPLNEKFIWLLALSSGTYLVYKAAPHTNDAPADGSAGRPGGASGSPPPSPPPPPAPGVYAVTMRLAIDDAASVQGLQLMVDGRTVPVPPTGLVELALEVGKPHTVAASGMRNGVRVQGDLAVAAPSRDDDQKPLSLRLA